MLVFCNTGIEDRVYRNGNYGVRICRKTGIYMRLKPINDLRQIKL